MTSILIFVVFLRGESRENVIVYHTSTTKYQSSWSTIFSIWNTMIGSTLVALPYGFSCSGTSSMLIVLNQEYSPICRNIARRWDCYPYGCCLLLHVQFDCYLWQSIIYLDISYIFICSSWIGFYRFRRPYAIPLWKASSNHLDGRLNVCACWRLYCLPCLDEGMCIHGV